MEILILVFMAIFGLGMIAAPIYFVVAWIRSRQGKRKPPQWVGLALWALVSFSVVAIALPNFLSFSAKSKQSEAKTNLGALFTVQIAYSGESGNYAGGSDAFNIMGWEPEGETRYAYFCDEALIANSKGAQIDQRPGGDWPFPVKPASSATGFTCMALGNIDNDLDLDVWSMNDAKMIVNLQSDEKKPVLDWRMVTLWVLIGLLAVAAVADVMTRRRLKMSEKAESVDPAKPE